MQNKGVKVKPCHLSEEVAVRTHFSHLSGEQTFHESSGPFFTPSIKAMRLCARSRQTEGAGKGAEGCRGDAERAPRAAPAGTIAERA